MASKAWAVWTDPLSVLLQWFLPQTTAAAPPFSGRLGIVQNAEGKHAFCKGRTTSEMARPRSQPKPRCQPPRLVTTGLERRFRHRLGHPPERLGCGMVLALKEQGAARRSAGSMTTD